MTRRSPIFAIFLALALALASVTMAVARGQAASGTTMVICSGYGVVSIAVDSNGNPIGPVHPCPDCLAGVAVFLAPGPVAVQRPATRSTAIEIPPGPRAASITLPQPRARGPPSLV